MLIDEKDDVIILEGLEKCLEGSLQNRPLCRTLAGLELARDLYISSNYEKSVENFSNKCSQQPAAVVAELQEVKRHKAASAVLPTVANKVEQIELDTSVSGQPAKKSAFRTGKEQFLLEGGKLPTPAATSTSSSGGMSSLIKKAAGGKSDDSPLPEELKNCDKALVEKIEAEIVVRGQPVTFGDIAGLEFAKKCVNELICWPMTRPDLFQGLRSLPKGLLLFGPPGTGT
jgi:SpoVK/Ycf46/Vps4 family AAA+-type ATPase